MNWWGKIIGGGFGFMLGGPLGALLGAAIGHQLDKNLVVLLDVDAGQTQRTQAAFFTTVFSVMGYVAKADGKVSKVEIGIAEQLMAQMRLTAEQRRAAIELFNQGKEPGFDVLRCCNSFAVNVTGNVIYCKCFWRFSFQLPWPMARYMGRNTKH